QAPRLPAGRPPARTLRRAPAGDQAEVIFRVLFFILVYVPFMLVAIPLQFVLARLGLPGWNRIPLVFHRLGAAFLGLKLTVIGQPVEDRPVLIVSNHISWTDIVAIGAAVPVTFV